ncbi:hypothetical protein D9M70_507680 [compost metagenome]
MSNLITPTAHSIRNPEYLGDLQPALLAVGTEIQLLHEQAPGVLRLINQLLQRFFQILIATTLQASVIGLNHIVQNKCVIALLLQQVLRNGVPALKELTGSLTRQVVTCEQRLLTAEA